jgi:nitrite reductase/ring-hydroxylating ferredoxin subunit
LPEFYVPAIRAEEIADGGMRTVSLQGQQIVICNCEGTFYAVAHRCGHMNAPMDRGTLVGTILTCPLHCARFDVVSGAVLGGPLPTWWGPDEPPHRVARRLANEAALMAQIHTEPLQTYPTRLQDGWVLVAI